MWNNFRAICDPIFSQCQDIFKSTFKQQFFGNNFYLKLRTMDLLYAFFSKTSIFRDFCPYSFFLLKSWKLQKNLRKIMKIQLVLLQGLQSNETCS